MLFGKKKTAVANISETQKILGQALAKQKRVEGAPILACVMADSKAQGVFIKEPGQTLSEDLGGSNGIVLYYLKREKRLTLILKYAYEEGSEEIKLVEECLEDFDLDLSPEERLPGDVTAIHTKYITDKARTNVELSADGVKPRDLASAADRLLGSVFDWLDVVYEQFDEQT